VNFWDNRQAVMERGVEMKVVGLDIGTTTIGGVVLDLDCQRIICSLVRNNRATLNSGQLWERIQDPRMIFETVLEILDHFELHYAGIEGIGVTGQMHGILYADASGNAVSPLYTWQDERGNLRFRDGQTYAEYCASLTGYPMAAGIGLTTHFYNLSNHLVPEGTASLCTIADYVAMKLAGLKRPVCDLSNAAGLGLFDLKSLRFDTEALAGCGMDAALLPSLPVARNADGPLNTAPCCKAIGESKTGIPVFTAIGDNQASFIGAVRDLETALLVNVGTGSQISAYTDRYTPGTRQLDLRPFPGGGYILVGAPLCGGRSYALLENFFREVLRRFAQVEYESLYDVMNSLGEAVLTREDSLKVDTKFSGTRTAPGVRGGIYGIGQSNFTPGHLVAGFLEGIAGELEAFYRLFPAAIREKTGPLVGSGNGIRKNGLLQKILARQFRKEIKIPLYEEEASYGAALCAATGHGCFHSIREALKINGYQEE
jgi:sedoheptulokinase